MSSLIKLYVSSPAFKTLDAAINYCVDNAIDLEVSTFARADTIDTTSEDDLKRLNEQFKQNNIKNITLHGACQDLCPSSLDPKIVEVTKIRHRQSIEIARKLNANTVIFHSGYNSHVKAQSYINSFIKRQIEYWIRLLEENQVNDLIVTLENTYEETPDILLQIYEGVNSEYFKSCLDLGHVITFSNNDLLTWIKTLNKYLHHFHLHNNNGLRDEHSSLIKGKIDFDEFFNTILTMQKPLNLVLEIFEKNEVIESLEYVRKYFPRS